VGVGKALYRLGEYAEAAEYFQLGQDVKYYSMAYQKTRGNFMADNFTLIVVGVGVLAAGIAALAVRAWLKKRAGGGGQ
jgi:formate-dependent nitrite reductase membrane component NrfD